jgi:hypothetical protein
VCRKGGSKLRFRLGDIVRFKPEKEILGLHEVTGIGEGSEVTLTFDECNSEFYADENDLILVCPEYERRDV